MLRSIRWAAVVICVAAPAAAQQVNQLHCSGVFAGAPAEIVGIRKFAPYNALGDGQVQFRGTIAAAGMQGSIGYEGYTRTAPFTGIVEGPLGTKTIGVLDNTGGRMLIYDGTASLGPPRTLGEFACAWR